MSMDGVVIRAIIHELNQMITGGRISKIYQPNKRDLTFVIRSQGKNHRLCLSAHPTLPRIHLTTSKEKNPQIPPPFCMILRKFCEGGTIESIQQVGMDRIVHLNILTRDEIGDRVIKRLVIEIMGKHSNIILVNPENNRIFDSIVRVTDQMSQVRQIAPGLPYQSPPTQTKSNPLEVEYDPFIAGFDYNGGRLDRQIINRFSGIGPQTAKEIIHRWGIGSREELWNAFQTLMQQIRDHQYQPSIIETENKKILTVLPLTSIQGKTKSFSSINQCVDEFYTSKAQQDQLRQQRIDLQRLIQNELTRSRKKLKLLIQESNDDQKAEQARLFGELLMASLHQIKRGAKEAEVANFFDPKNRLITIPLDPAKTPVENAENYFKKYRKYQAAKKWKQKEVEKTQEKIAYLETVQMQLSHPDQREIDQIREELEEVGIVKPKPQKNRKTLPPNQHYFMFIPVIKP